MNAAQIDDIEVVAYITYGLKGLLESAPHVIETHSSRNLRFDLIGFSSLIRLARGTSVIRSRKYAGVSRSSCDTLVCVAPSWGEYASLTVLSKAFAFLTILRRRMDFFGPTE